MANDFVNTITTKDGTTYDVQDKRLEVTAADAGKVVSVDSEGNLSLTIPSGTKLYKHELKYASSHNGSPSGDTLFIISTDKDAYTELPRVNGPSIVSIYFRTYYHAFSGENGDPNRYYQYVSYVTSVQTPYVSFGKVYKSNASDFDTVTEL